MSQENQLVDAIRTLVHQNGRHYSVKDVRKRLKDETKTGLVSPEVRQSMDALYSELRHSDSGAVGSHLAVALDDYPGLIGLLQEAELRKLLVHDTRQGVVFVRKEAIPYLPLARSSPVTREIMDARAGLDIFRRMAMESDYDYSLRGIFHKYSHALPPDVVVQADVRFNEIEERLQRTRPDEFLSLALGVEEYGPRRLELWQTLGELIVYAIEFLASAVNRFQNLSSEERKDVRRALLVCSSSLISLKTLAEVYVAHKAHRFDFAVIYVQETALSPAFAL